MSKAYVYVICANDRTVKIGIARDVGKRLKALQTANSERLLLHSFTECSEQEAISTEREAHYILKEKRMVGEWFCITPEEAQITINKALDSVRNNKTEFDAHKRERVLRKEAYSIKYFVSNSMRAMIHMCAAGYPVIWRFGTPNPVPLHDRQLLRKVMQGSPKPHLVIIASLQEIAQMLAA